MKNKIPLAVPAIGGGASQQAPFDLTEAIQQQCNNCSGDTFEKLYRISYISSVAPGNRTGQKITVESPVYICYHCGMELGDTAQKQSHDPPPSASSGADI